MTDKANKVRLLREVLGYSMLEAARMVEALALIRLYESRSSLCTDAGVVDEIIKEKRGLT